MRSLARLVLLATLALAACSDGRETGTDPQVPGDGDASTPGPSADATPIADVDAGFDLPDLGDASIELACSIEEAQPIIQCGIERCAAAATDPGALTACLTTSCGALLLTLSPECLTCALVALSGDPEAIAGACASGLPATP